MNKQPYQQLEQEFGELFGQEHCVACASGTAALTIALQTLELPKGSRVLVPEYTFIATARACTLAGLRPIFVDVDDSGLMPPIRTNCKAILPVHILGRRALYPIGNKLIVEDACQYAVPNESYGKAICYSFQETKVIHGEEGGMACFADKSRADLARQLRSFGRDANGLVIPGSSNYRLSNANASLVLGSLRNYSLIAKRRADNEQQYNELIPKEWQLPPRDSCWMYDLRLPDGTDQKGIVAALTSEGIMARSGFLPMSMQPEYRGEYKQLNAYKISQQTIYLPVENCLPKLVVEALMRAIEA